VTIRREDEGFTVSELAVVLLVFGIVSAVIFQALASFTSGTAAAEVNTQALAEARTAVETISRDLRAANPIEIDTSMSYPTRVAFSVYCSSAGSGTCSAANQRRIIYRVVNNELRRTVGSSETVLLGPSGPSSLPRNRQRGAVVNKNNEPVFTYFDQNGAEVPASAPENYRNCAKAVKIRIAVVSDLRRADQDVDIATTVNLRNHNKVTNCTP
jgi:type II secretory pathway component PulJ